MQSDAETLHRAVTILSHGRSMIHMLCGRLNSAIEEAKKTNSGRRFKKFEDGMKEATKKMERIAEEYTKIGQTIEEMEWLTRKLEGEN